MDMTPLSDRSSAIGKTENNIMINPFLLLFANPFSISLGSSLTLPAFIHSLVVAPSLSLSLCLCIILENYLFHPQIVQTYLFLKFPAKNKSSSIYRVALLDCYLIRDFVKDAAALLYHEGGRNFCFPRSSSCNSRGWSVKVYLPFNPLIFNKASLSLVLIVTSFVFSFCTRRSVKPAAASLPKSLAFIFQSYPRLHLWNIKFPFLGRILDSESQSVYKRNWQSVVCLKNPSSPP